MGQWLPGQSGNPNGPPRTKPWKDALRRALKREQRLRFDGSRLHPSIISVEDENGTVIVPEAQMLEVIADMTVQRAACGDHEAMIEIGNRLDGRPPQTLEGSDVPIIHSVRWLEDDETNVSKPANGDLEKNANDNKNGTSGQKSNFSDELEFAPVPRKQIEYLDKWEGEDDVVTIDGDVTKE
jgi:hypothetical protein